MSKKGYKQTEEHKRASSKFTKEEEIEIERQYREEEFSTCTLAKKWNSNSETIREIILRNGGKLRSLKEASKTHRHLERMRGENHPQYGTHRSKVTKQKIGDKNRGKKRSKEEKQKMGEAHKGQKAWNKNIPFSKESKEKMSKSALLRIQNYSGPFKDTKPELKMKEILISLTIPFEHQFRVEGINHNFDFYILNTNILIEVDGDYYHGNPRKFSKLNGMQWYQKERDIKNEIRSVNSGFRLLRFWEDDILHNTEEVKEKICKEIF